MSLSVKVAGFTPPTTKEFSKPKSPSDSFADCFFFCLLLSKVEQATRTRSPFLNVGIIEILLPKYPLITGKFDNKG